MKRESVKHLESAMKRVAQMSALLFVICVTQSPGLAVELSDTQKQASVLIEQFALKESHNDSRQMPGWRQPKKVVLWANDKTLADFQASFPELTIIATSNAAVAQREVTNADIYIGYCLPAVVDAMEKVLWIHSLSVGVENCVQSSTIQEAQPIITNSQRLSAPGIAEHAIGMMFTLVRRLDQYAAAQAESQWDNRLASGEELVWEIKGRTMLVVGLGGIGTEVAKRAHGLGMKVVATRNTSRKGPDFVEYVGLSDELFALAKKADIVVNTVPLTEKTGGLFNREFFKQMPAHGYFINIARGKSVVTDDLLAALKAGEIAGAGLDVTDPEPLPSEHPLWQQPRVIITPHIAYRSEKLRARINTLAKENLRRFINGEKLLSQVDIDRGY